MKVYTRKGDDGTTGLLFGGRVRKDAPAPTAYGDVDEAQAAIGLARSETESGSELDALLVELERDLWIVMAELATDPTRRAKLVPGTSMATPEMVTRLEELIDEFSERFDPPREFVVPGETRVAARLDLARTVVRRAERSCVGAAVDDSSVGPYLNRLSDLLWTLARWHEGSSRAVRTVGGTRPVDASGSGGGDDPDEGNPE